MNIYKDFMKSTKTHENLLCVLLIIYIVFDIQVPNQLLNIVNNNIFQIILILLVFSLFFYVNPIISILAIIAIFTLFSRAKGKVKGFIPSEINKLNKMMNYNSDNKTAQASVSLEEDMVQKMAPPIIETNPTYSFQPILENEHNAKTLVEED